MTQQDSSQAAVVDKSYHYRRITASTELNKTMVLINRPAGVAKVGILGKGEKFFTHWAPVPTFNDADEQEAP